MEENVKLMSVLKIGLEASKQGHGRGGMLRAGLYITSSLARAVGGNDGGEWSMWVKVTAATPISQSIPYEPNAQGSWVAGLESSAHPEALTYVTATETGFN